MKRVQLFSMKTKVTRLVVGFLLVSVFLVYPPRQAEAKFWGNETTSAPSTAADGRCWSYNCTTYYVFWIAVSSDCEYVLMGETPCVN